jgi:hypothetical protein
MNALKCSLIIVVLIMGFSAWCETAFVYQGRLTDGLEAASGAYDFEFRLYDAAEDGALMGAAVIKDDVAVDGGLFEVELDFGHDLFTGAACYLEIGVRSEGEQGALITLTPRQAFIPAPSAWEYPYAVYAAEIKSSGEGENAALTVTGIQATDGNATVIPLDGIKNIDQGDSSTVHTTTDYSTISGGLSNTIGHATYDWDYCTIGGGYGNTASGNAATVGGGHSNTASLPYAAVGGGNSNTASGTESTVGGGAYNTASGEDATVGGGKNNTADNLYATIGGGYLNKANGDGASVGGGRYNEASGLYSCVPGGRKNRAVNYAFAAGYRARAAHKGSFVWADSTEANMATTANNQFLARAKGGFKFYTNAAMTSGAKLNPGGGSWVNMSDRKKGTGYSFPRISHLAPACSLDHRRRTNRS